MNFVEKVYEKQIERTLKEVIFFANQRLIKPERARLLILLAKDMSIVPKDLATASLDWRSED